MAVSRPCTRPAGLSATRSMVCAQRGLSLRATSRVRSASLRVPRAGTSSGFFSASRSSRRAWRYGSRGGLPVVDGQLLPGDGEAHAAGSALLGSCYRASGLLALPASADLRADRIGTPFAEDPQDPVGLILAHRLEGGHEIRTDDDPPRAAISVGAFGLARSGSRGLHRSRALRSLARAIASCTLVFATMSTSCAR